MRHILNLRRKETGQSLVELALVLPLLIFILGGVIEIVNLIITQNRISNAARAGSAYGSGNITDWSDPDSWSTEMGEVAFNSVGDTGTMSLDPERWDIWTIKATLDAGGNWVEWVDVHTQGNNTLVPQSEWEEALEVEVQKDILDELSANNPTGATLDGLQIIVTAAYYRSESLVGLPQYLYPTRLEGLSVMRVDEPPPYSGCDVFPIAVSYDSWSLFPEVTDPMFTDDDIYENYPVDGWDVWPNRTSGAPHPTYEDFSALNMPGVHISQTRAGYIFKVKDDATQPGSFGWLTWNECNSQQCLDSSLHYPGNANIFEYDGDLNGNGKIDQYDLVKAKTGNVASAWGTLEEYLMADGAGEGRTIKLLVFTPEAMENAACGNGNWEGDYNCDGRGSNGTGQNAEFEVLGFITVRIQGGHASQGQGGGWLLIEALKWSGSCGDLGER